MISPIIIIKIIICLLNLIINNYEFFLQAIPKKAYKCAKIYKNIKILTETILAKLNGTVKNNISFEIKILENWA
jgi:hypothetical protein